MGYGALFAEVRLSPRILATLTLIFLTSCKNPLFSPSSGGQGSGAGSSNVRPGTHGNDGSGFSHAVAGLFGRRGSTKLGPNSTNGKIVVTLPRDRCKAGTITFGNVKCQAVGRGLTRYSNPGSRSWIQGSHSNGTPCWYLNSKVTNGATPATTYTLGAVRAMGRDKRHWGQDGIRMNDNVSGRGGFVVHSVRGFTENTNAEVQNGYGCIRIPQECMTKLHEYRKNGGAGQPFEVNEI